MTLLLVLGHWVPSAPRNAYVITYFNYNNERIKKVPNLINNNGG